MLSEFIHHLPGEIDEVESGWGLWQVDAITLLLDSVGFLPYGTCMIAGCDPSGVEWIYGGEDEDIEIDAIVLAYEDGCDEKEIIEVVDAIRGICTVITQAVDWARITPKSIHASAKRLKNGCGFNYRRRPAVAGVPRSREQIIEMERSKSDRCDLNLVHLPDWPKRMEDALLSIVNEYIGAVAGDPPPGVELRWLWRSDPRSRSLLTNQPAKSMVGWGLNHTPDDKMLALYYADRFRFAAYSILSSIDWESLTQDNLKTALTEDGVWPQEWDQNDG